MRAGLAIVILVLALVLAAVDWQATIGQGYAYRLSTTGTLVAGAWPETFDNAIHAMRSSGVPWLWDPIGAFLMSLPLALVLAAVAAVLWVTRPREARRR